MKKSGASPGKEIAMNLTWRDAVTTVLAALGVLAVIAKIAGYSWWLVGSWKGAVATVGVLGLLMLLVNTADLVDFSEWSTWAEATLWLGAAALVVVGLFVASQPLFYIAAAVIGLAWLTSLARHEWETTTHHRQHPSTPYITT